MGNKAIIKTAYYGNVAVIETAYYAVSTGDVNVSLVESFLG